MMLLADSVCQVEARPRPTRCYFVPKIRPSILDPMLETEPWLDYCACSDALVLFVHNHPVAVISATSLDAASITTQMFQLRHRYPRQT